MGKKRNETEPHKAQNKELYCHGFSNPAENLGLRPPPKVLRTRRHTHGSSARSSESTTDGHKSLVDHCPCQADKNANIVRQGKVRFCQFTEFQNSIVNPKDFFYKF